MTGEGRVKDALKKYLTSIGLIPASQAPLATQANTGWFFMPVSNGMGVSGIPDFIGVYKGRFFAVETKVEKKNPTALQQHQLNAINLTGGAAFVMRGEHDLWDIMEWVSKINQGGNNAK